MANDFHQNIPRNSNDNLVSIGWKTLEMVIYETSPRSDQCGNRLPSFTEFYLVLLSFTEFYRVLVGIGRPWRVPRKTDCHWSNPVGGFKVQSPKIPLD